MREEVGFMARAKGLEKERVWSSVTLTYLHVKFYGVLDIVEGKRNFSKFQEAMMAVVKKTKLVLVGLIRIRHLV